MTSHPERDRVTLLMRTIAAALGLAAIVLHYLADVSLGLLWLGLFVGWPLLGALITLDDDLPGGWGSPDGAASPPWRDPVFGAQLAFGVAAAALGFAHDLRWRSVTSLILVAIALGGIALGRIGLRKGGRIRDSAR